jgi:hypothetical protein
VYFKNWASNLQQGGLSHELEEAHRVVRVQGGVRAEGEPHFRTVPNLDERTIKKKIIETIFFFVRDQSGLFLTAGCNE